MPRIDIAGLKKSFGATVAVAGFDLGMDHGEFVALLGPSGCGKSTVMRMIAGIAEPDAGSIQVGTRRLDGLPPERRNVGLFFQSYALFPHMTVEANVGFGLRMRGVARPEIARRVEAVLGLMELGGYGRRLPRQLSGGQQQRVALARALVIEPDVLLLDEPLSSLDAQLRDQLREEIRSLQRRLGITAIYVTHDQSEALALADRVVVMQAGRVVEIGTPVDLYRRPKTRFTAAFVGQTNLIDATRAGGTIALPWGQEVPHAGDRAGPVTVSLRPEDIAVRADPAGAGEIEEIGFLGADVDYRVRVGAAAIRARASGAGAVLLAAGTRVSLEAASPLHVIEGERG
jgi:putative spermidine/putrescine transport system ATP-binding protein